MPDCRAAIVPLCALLEQGADLAVAVDAEAFGGASRLAPGGSVGAHLRHVADFFAMTVDEKRAVIEILDQACDLLAKELAPDGYNIGVNVGAAAGQSRMHVHVHLIPRFRGDVADPRGGIRCVLGKISD